MKYLNYFLHIDKYLGPVIDKYGAWTYGILFLVIFLETGLVVTPFLPGDSLLFAAGAFSAQGFLNPVALFALLSVAAVAGDTLNYSIGRRVGRAIFEQDRPLLRKDYFIRTEQFYQKHGHYTIIIARFMPIIRTFAPFVAGVGRMNYATFISFNIIGGLAWIAIFVFGGYFFGNIPVIKQNFSLVIAAIIFISFIPPLIEFFKHRSAAAKSTPANPDDVIQS